MATVTTPPKPPKVKRDRDGKRVASFYIRLSTVGLADEVEITEDDGFFSPCELILFEAELVTGGSASTLQPEIGTATTFSLDSIEEVAVAALALAHHRIQGDSNGKAPYIPPTANKLVIRPIPDAATATTVDLRVTIREA